MSEITAHELEKAFSGNHPMLVYFGFEDCPWCKEALPIIMKVAKSERVQVSYFDTAAEENEEYYTTMKRVLCDEYNLDYILVPLVISIRVDRKIGGFHMGTVDNHNAISEKMTMEQVDELELIYAAIIQNWKETIS